MDGSRSGCEKWPPFGRHIGRGHSSTAPMVSRNKRSWQSQRNGANGSLCRSGGAAAMRRRSSSSLLDQRVDKMVEARRRVARFSSVQFRRMDGKHTAFE